ncbi:MAG: restriction endonuclease [Variovorax paradoxus]|uniref:Restriction endonuclease n=1 Tax=Variovorax paradoxus TaxID=34073 RepID=A0A2W5QEU3_VARPD|nr:MAG: restriction endonuclease [Variovorax paradoxus]
MGWRDVISAVLDATAAAPAQQASRTTSANNKAAVPASDAKASVARPRPVRPAPPEPERHAPERAWSAAVFDHIEWRRFEAVCEALFAQSGMRSESQSHGADGGVDIWLYSQHSDKPVIVQCKHWKKRVVGVKELREFYGVLKSHDLTYGTFATSSTFSSEAFAFAKSNRINALDRERLLGLIEGRTAQQRRVLLDTAYEGEYWKPTCVKCGMKMALRAGRDGGPFWGCSNYGRTKCRGSMRVA